MMQKANKEFDQIVKEEAEKKATEAALNALSDDTTERVSKLKGYAMSRILELEDISAEKLERICNRVLSTADGKRCIKQNNEAVFARLVNNALKGEPKKSVRKKQDSQPAPESKVILNFLENDSPKEADS